MNLPRPNPFWSVIALSVAVLVAVVSMVLVPRRARVAELRREVRRDIQALQAARPGTPTREEIAGWRRHRDELIRDYSKVSEFFTESDRSFEKWFPGLSIGPRGAPSRDAFAARYRDEIRRLESELRAAGVRIGAENDDRAPGFNWEDLRIQQLDDVGAADEAFLLHEVQKRFWVRQRVGDLVLRSRVKVGRIVDFRFFARLHDKIRDVTPLGGGSETVAWPGVSESGLPRDFQETPLPNGLGRTFTFGIVLELPTSETARALAELLNPGTERLLLTVIGSQITLRDQNPVKVEVEHAEGNTEELKRKKAELGEKYKPRDVLFVITGRILDIDPAGVK